MNQNQIRCSKCVDGKNTMVMLSDLNKGITEILYNHLNLPTQISFANGSGIEYFYNAARIKIEKKVHDTQNNTIKQVEYMDGFQYAGGVLQFFPTAEGYVAATKNVNGIYIYNYVYNYTDHLGNVRLSYSKDPQTGNLRILDESHYYPFGLKHLDYNVTGFIWSPVGVILSPIPNNPFKYRFQSQELQDEHNLNWYAYRYRNYDPAIGRFFNVDPLSESFAYNGVYNFSENRVIDGFELEGLETVLVNNETGEILLNKKPVELEGRIYHFKLGNTDSGFKSFMKSFTQSDFHDIHTSIYNQRMQPYNTPIAQKIYGLDTQGNIAVPQYIKDREWEAALNDLYPSLKDAWTSQTTGIDPNSFLSQVNPVDQIKWKMTRALTVTNNAEALDMIGSIGLDITLQWIATNSFKIGVTKARYVPINSVEVNAAKTVAPTLEGAVKSNFGRFVSKMPANAKSNASFQLLDDGSYLFQATSPGKVPGSSALYQKWVNPQGETFKVIKTTFAPDGSIIHVKPKL